MKRYMRSLKTIINLNKNGKAVQRIPGMMNSADIGSAPELKNFHYKSLFSCQIIEQINRNTKRVAEYSAALFV